MTDTIKQERVNKAVWAACDTFRGTVSADIDKDYVLTLLFLTLLFLASQFLASQFLTLFFGALLCLTLLFLTLLALRVLPVVIFRGCFQHRQTHAALQGPNQ